MPKSLSGHLIRRTILHGFTIVEVLIVIGIVALLAAIVLPVTSHAREAGRRTTCQSNLRQIAAAMGLYVQDSDGVYPLDMAVHPPPSGSGPPIAFPWYSAISPYVKDRGIFRCPTHSEDLFHGDDYTFNAPRLNTFLPKGPRGGTSEASLPQASTTWLVVDSGFITPDGVYHFSSRADSTSCGRPFIGSTIHGGGGNYSFLDGHVRWFTPEAMGEVDCQNGPLPFPFRNKR